MAEAALESPEFDYQEGAEVTVEVGEDLSRAIDKLNPDTTEGKKLHDTVKDFLTKKIEASESEMSRFHSRWAVNEMKVQAYITLPDYEKVLKQMNQDKGAPPVAVPVVVPFAYAAHSTIVTFLIHTFAGRRPLFPLGTYKDEAVDAARNMEEVIQYQADHARLVKKLWQHFSDIGLYGVGAFWNEWCVKTAMRTSRIQVPVTSIDGGTTLQSRRERKKRTVYEGNEVENVDPFLFYPDPRVPMSEVNRRGEFVFYRTFVSKLALKKMALQEDSGIEYIDKIPPGSAEMNKSGTPWSNRSLISGGEPIPGRESLHTPGTEDQAEYFIQLDQGTIEIIPKDLGIDDSETPEKWFFILANKHQVIAAERVDDDHDMHRVAVSEPTGFGYGFGQPAMMDFIAPIQDLISWFVNSHVDNVRLALNNMFIYDPSMIERKDLERPGPGKAIRLKQSAYGQDVKNAVMQLQVFDVTGNHPENVELMMRLGQLMLGFNENVMGVPQQGGRKTATEMRIAGEAAVSRLALLARIISSQSITDLTEQQVLNTQQYLSDEFAMTVLGENGRKILVTPEHLVGDFTYVVHDGLLPPDRLALFQIWKEGTEAIAQDQELRATFDLAKMVEYTMELGGARNIEQFRRSPGEVQAKLTPDAQVEAGAQAGNMIPISQAMQELAGAA